MSSTSTTTTPTLTVYPLGCADTALLTLADGERILHTERSFGKVTRSFSLPQELDEAKAEAKFRDGVLELTLPKKAAATRKPIQIQ